MLVHVRATGICGSDLHYLRHGAIGAFVVRAPMILGHESAGEIVAVGAGVDRDRMGQLVAIEPGIPCRCCSACKSGHYNLCPDMQFAATPPVHGTLQKHYLVPADFAHPLPVGLTGEEGSLMEPLAVAVHIVRRLGIVPGATCVVFGCGPVGLLCQQVARAYNATHILAVDVDESRVAFAAKYTPGTHTFVPPTREANEKAMAYSRRVATAISERFPWMRVNGGGAHAVVDATGAEVCTQMGILCTRRGGTFCQAGMGATDIILPIDVLCSRELTVLGCFRYDEGCYKQAIDLVARGSIDVKQLITHRYAFQDAEQAFDKMGSGEAGVLKVIIEGHP